MAVIKNYVVTDLETGAYSMTCGDTANKAVAIFVNNKLGYDMACINVLKVKSASEALLNAHNLGTKAYAAFSQSGVPSFHYLELIPPIRMGVKIKVNKEVTRNIRIDKDSIRFDSLKHFIDALYKKGWVAEIKDAPDDNIYIRGFRNGRPAGAAILYTNEYADRVVIRGTDWDKKTFEVIHCKDDYWNIFQSLLMQGVIVIPEEKIQKRHSEIQKFMGRYM